MLPSEPALFSNSSIVISDDKFGNASFAADSMAAESMAGVVGTVSTAAGEFGIVAAAWAMETI
ncbi:hypothetical protein LBMAG56_38480 [Verrucomicrobiota bacterium]|nr:hypothetical protein LBMAG56_38480 [Verrucomicrobiota bacterium]